VSRIKGYLFQAAAAVLSGALLLSSAVLSVSVSAVPEFSVPAPTQRETADSDTELPNNTDVSPDDNTRIQKIPYEVSSSSALDPFHNGGDYSAVLYNNVNGLTTSEANDIVQTQDGFIWIGSYGGLVRYDGSKFEQIALDKTMSGIKSLFVDSLDRLWIGSANNGVAVLENGNFTYWFESDGLPEGSIDTIQEDDSGNIFIGTREGLMTIDSNKNLTRFDDRRINDSHITDIEKGVDGRLYCLSDKGDVFTVRNSYINSYIRTNKLYGFTCLTSHPDDPDIVYLGQRYYTYILDLRSASDVHLRTSSVEMEEVSFAGIEDIQDLQIIDNKVWICAGTGIGVYEPEDDQFHPLVDVPMTGSMEHMMKDFQGNYWFTSSRQGVIKVVPNRFRNVLEYYGLSETIVNTTCYYNDFLFVGTDTGLIVIGPDGALDSYSVKAFDETEKRYEKTDLIGNVLMNMRIRSIVCDSKNRLWIATWGNGLFCLEGNTLFLYDSYHALISDSIRAVLELSDGAVCAVGLKGMSVIENRSVIANFTAEDGIKNTSCLTAAEDSEGNILIGTDGGGIYVVNRDHGIVNITTADGLSSGIVMRIKKDRTRDILWLVTNNSISYITKDHEIKQVTSFPYTNNFDLYQSSKDDMWVLSSNGIYVVPTEEMIADNVYLPLRYTAMNGLPCIATANSYSYLTENGDLYIAGNAGVIRVNIESDTTQRSDYRCAVPYVGTDGKRIYPDNNGIFHIASNVRKLTIYGFVMNYSLTDLLVTYRLKGFDEDETSLSSKNLMPIDYTNLPGGEYTFSMDVADSVAQTHTTRIIKIVKDKALYEEPWYWIVVVIISILAIVGIMLLIMIFRMRKIQKKNRDSMMLIREITEAFAKVIDMKDTYTNGHSTRVAKYTMMLAEELGYNKEMTEKFYHVALLHDIGKVGIPTEVLNKPGKLTDEEFEIIKSHTSMGYGTLEGISLMPELAFGARSHHERPDRKGYPDHLKGDEIPRVAQIIAVADCFDAMYSNRPYRNRMNFEKAVSIIKDASGTQLTPDVVDAFLRLVEKGCFRAEDDYGGGTTENIENIRSSGENESQAKS